MKEKINAFQDKLMDQMEKVEVLTENRYIKAITNSMMAYVPFTIICGFAYILAFLPVPGYEKFINAIGIDFNAYYSALVDIGNATMNIAAIIVVVYFAYKLAENYKDIIQPINAAVLSLCIFIFTSPNDGGSIAISSFGATSLFTAMLMAIAVTELYRFFVKKKFTIKMPPSVPSNVSASFTALIPMGFIIIIFAIIKIIASIVGFDSIHSIVNSIVAAPFTAIGTSIWGFQLMLFITLALWGFGIHGNSVVFSLLTPALLVATDANRLAFEAGEKLPYIITNEFLMFATGVGIWRCIAMLLFCKSKKIKSLGKIAIVPAFFGINEPTIFGLPVVFNPIMWIPYFLCDFIGPLLTYIGTYIGWIPRLVGVSITWTTPNFLNGYLLTGGKWTAVLWQLALGIIYLAIYYPFLKTYDRKVLAEEKVLIVEEGD